MNNQSGFLCTAIVLAFVAGIGTPPPYVQNATAIAMGAPNASSTRRNPIVAELSPEQAAECDRELQVLEEKLNQCTTDECRKNVRAEIVVHNAKCR